MADTSLSPRRLAYLAGVRRQKRRIKVADGSNHEFRHITLVCLKLLQIRHDALVNLIRLAQVRIAVGNEIAVAKPSGSIHDAVSAALDADIDPQVIVS